MVTPFDKTGNIDYNSTYDVMTYLIENETDSILLTGTTGESPTLTHAEEFKLYEFAVKHFKGKIPLIGGTGSNCTQTAIKTSLEAEKIGFVNTPLSTGVETGDNEITMNFYGANSRHALRSRWAFGRNDFALIRVGPDIWNIDEEGMQLKKDSLGQASWDYIVNKDRGIVDRGSVGDDEVKKTILKFYPDLEKVLRQYK